MVLVDAGPLIALLHADDAHHQICKATLKGMREPMVTVWPAVAEAMYLLSFSPLAQDALWQMLGANVLGLLPLDRSDVPRMRELMRKYRTLPMDLADAALVRTAEREKIATIFTLDRRDFQVYRPIGLKGFRLLPESPS